MTSPKYFKILNKNITHNGYKFETSLNIDSLPWNPDPDCSPGGFYFTTAEYVWDFIDHGSLLAEIEVPQGIEISVGEHKRKAHQIIIKNIRELWDLDTIKYLVEHGAPADDPWALRSAARCGHHDIVKYLKSAQKKCKKD